MVCWLTLALTLHTFRPELRASMTGVIAVITVRRYTLKPKCHRKFQVTTSVNRNVPELPPWFHHSSPRSSPIFSRCLVVRPIQSLPGGEAAVLRSRHARGRGAAFKTRPFTVPVRQTGCVVNSKHPLTHGSIPHEWISVLLY